MDQTPQNADALATTEPAAMLPEKRTPLKPPTYDKLWMRGLNVELGPKRAKGVDGSDYTVYLDGALVGWVSSQRERSSRPMAQGSRIHRSTGSSLTWRSSGGVWRTSDTRYDAVSFLIHATLDKRQREQ